MKSRYFPQQTDIVTISKTIVAGCWKRWFAFIHRVPPAVPASASFHFLFLNKFNWSSIFAPECFSTLYKSPPPSHSELDKCTGTFDPVNKPQEIQLYIQLIKWHFIYDGTWIPNTISRHFIYFNEKIYFLHKKKKNEVTMDRVCYYQELMKYLFFVM